MKRVPRSNDREAILQLEEEIGTLSESLRVMRAANSAIIAGDADALLAMGFESDHIQELCARHAQGKAGFPNYVIRNLGHTIQQLEYQKEALQRGPE